MFNWVCMILLLEKSIHVITGIVSAVVAIRSGSKPGTGTKFRKGSEIRASPRFGLGAKKTRSLPAGSRKGALRVLSRISVKRRRAVQRRDQAADRVSNQPAWGPAYCDAPAFVTCVQPCHLLLTVPVPNIDGH